MSARGRPNRPRPEDVEELLRNAELREELEPYFDEAISRVNGLRWPIRVENEYLAAMLAWEMAPVLPIYKWFDPELRPPRPDTLTDEQLHEILWDLIYRLYEKRIVLDFTDHLSDRELYTLIYRHILPSREKKLEQATHYIHWDCSAADGDPEVWLRYYASEAERQAWATRYGQPLPPKCLPPYPRELPRDPNGLP